jgi:nucleoside-diphosphate-sugar epimerase
MLAKSMLFTFLDRLGRGEPIDVADAGRYMSDLVFVDDVVAAILATLDRKVLGPLNIGAGRRRTSLEVARRVAAVVGAAPRLIRVAPAVAGVEPAVLPAVSIARARSELAFVPTGLAAGLRRTLAEDPRLRAVIAPGSRER